MKKFLFAILLGALNIFAAHVAVLETIGAPNTLDQNERMVLTDILRQIAVTTLPNYMGYTIMTRENINVMLPPGKAIEDCEGECLVETGKNISADYVAQARAGKFGTNLTVTVELYETASGKLMSSYVCQGADAMELMSEIKKRTPSLFSIIKGQQTYSGEGNEGFSQIQQGSSFTVTGTKQFLIKVESKPPGAMLSVDGKPKCKSTPCIIQIAEGSHTFSFALDAYFDKDTLLDVYENEQNLRIELFPNFGKLEISPKLQDGYAKISELDILVDGEKQKKRILHLAAGTHHIKLSHHCYEPLSFDVTVKQGSDLKFDGPMEPAMGGLSLTAEDENGPISIPLYINGKQKGKTPLYEPIPICAQLSIGKAKEPISVKLKYHETVNFVYKKRTELLKDKDGNVYKTIKIGNQVWMAENLKVVTKKGWFFSDETSVNPSKDWKKYGKQYTWEDAKKACPTGWHLPSKRDFETLFAAVGGIGKAGYALKSTQEWVQIYRERPDANGSDEFGFSAFPVGYRTNGSSSDGTSNSAYFWSSDSLNVTRGSKKALCMCLSSNYREADFCSHFVDFRLSVRCVKD